MKRGAGALIGLVAVCSVGFAGLNQVYPLDLAQRTDQSTTVFSREGEVLRQFANSKGVYRIATTHQEVSAFYLQALLEYEDKYFYYHPGVNPLALLRALGQQLYYGRVISGGSTLTMQVARMFYPHKRTYVGKLEQIFRAFQLELTYSKSQILDLYLTHTPMGGNIEGVEAASQRYYAKHADELSPVEAIMLVVVPQRPSLYRPDRHPQRALKARNKVLRRVHGALDIRFSDLERMLVAPLRADRHNSALFAPLLARRLKARANAETEIQTFIDFTIQSDVEQVIRQRSQQWSSPLSAAVLVMDNHNGEVLAYKGSADINDLYRYGHVDMVQAVRSPGSALKPFIYGVALDKGLVHSASLLTDAPRQFGDYRPHNFDRRFAGAIRLDHALQKSKNVPVVQVLNHVGPRQFMEQLNGAGIELKVAEANLAIALGGVGTRLEDLVTLFSSLARSGESIFPRFSVQDSIVSKPLLSSASSWILYEILKDIAPPDRVRAAYQRNVAWKTGTSYGYRDAWAIGTSADYTVGVWIGRPDGAPYVGQTGANQAAPLLFDVFDLLPKDRSFVTKPEQVTQENICWPSGLHSALVNSMDCAVRQSALTINHHTPPTLRQQSGFESLHQWPQPLLNWSKKTGNQLASQASNGAEKNIHIIRPKQGMQLFPYPGQLFTLVANLESVVWYLNDQKLPNNQLKLDGLQAGNYRLSACDVSCDTVQFSVN